MKVAVICPFDLNRLMGTPIRTRVTVRAVSTFAQISVIVTGGDMPEVAVFNVGKCNLFVFTRRALSILGRGKPDVVHGVTTVSIVPMMLYKLLHPSVRLIFEMHGWAWFEQKKSGAFFTRVSLLVLDLIGLWFSYKIITMSETQKAFLSRWTFKPSRIVVIWGPSEFDAAPTESNNEGVVVGYIGNSAWWQGLHHLVEAAQLLKSNKDVSFRLGGFDARDAKKFPRLPNVSYVGRVERPDVLQFLRSCDVLVSSRLKGGVSDLQYPQKLSEYLGASRPVIVSGANDQPLIVQRAQCGIVVDPMTGDTLAEAIQVFARMPREEKIQLGKNGGEFCKSNLHVAVFSTHLKDLYNSML